MTVRGLAQRALDEARAAVAEISRHEAVCVERYAMITRALEDSREQRAQLHRAIRELRAILLRAAWAVMALLGTGLSFFLVELFREIRG